MAQAEAATLLKLAQQGSETAFAALVNGHQAKLRTFLRRLVADRSEAEDLAQETFVTAWQKLADIKEDASFSTFICAIAYRKAANLRRSFWRRGLRDQAWFELMPKTETPMNEDRLSLESALKTLPLEQRACVILCVAQDHSHAEAAAILGLALGTVKSHVLRGREKLMKILRLDDHDPN